MSYEMINLWTEEMQKVGSGSAIGTFNSGVPGMSYHPAKAGSDRGAVLICPGGAYRGKTEHEQIPVAEKLNRHQLNAYILDYRVHPDLHPSAHQDIKRAIEIIRQRAKDGLHSDKVAVMGFSAGGHLAACAGTLGDDGQCRPDAMILAYPVITLGRFAHYESRLNLLGETPLDSLLDDLSLENRVDRKTPPTYIWHTADDEMVSVENSLLFASALAAKGVPFACHIFVSGAHGLGLAEDNPEVRVWFDEAMSFLNQLAF